MDSRVVGCRRSRPACLDDVPARVMLDLACAMARGCRRSASIATPDQEVIRSARQSVVVGYRCVFALTTRFL